MSAAQSLWSVKYQGAVSALAQDFIYLLGRSALCSSAPDVKFQFCIPEVVDGHTSGFNPKFSIHGHQRTLHQAAPSSSKKQLPGIEESEYSIPAHSACNTVYAFREQRIIR